MGIGKLTEKDGDDHNDVGLQCKYNDEEMEILDDLIQVRNFSEIDTRNPPLAPHFPFTANRAVHKNIDLQFLDIFLEMIVAETNQYADRIIQNNNLQRNSLL
ncbi:piggyBac transposable element-derived protein 4 [Nephila pilipes]|uniref:PiggyBac transposable element-derived protein 4 n=1 Tax=Nephila pilipes TaxID=299642 RepID=A0A8X6TFB4_NEPPI|nr:piggyBac transposable element-derived protein 4 [Nephila pilipes]